MNALADNVTPLRMPPHSLDAERSVLGAILIDPLCLRRIDLEDDDFYLGKHRSIFRAMKTCSEIDVITVAEALGDEVDMVGMDYLTSLTDTPTSKNVASYATIVKDKSLARQGYTACHAISQAALDGDLEGMWSAVADFQTLAKPSGSGGWLKDMIPDVLKFADDIKSGRIKPVMTGFPGMDNMTSGFFPGDFTVIAARTSVGKTATALNFAMGAGVPAEFITAEQSTLQLAQRCLAAMTQVPLVGIRKGTLLDFHRRQIETAVNVPQVHFTDKSAPTIAQVENIIRNAVYNLGCKIVYLDYIQYVRCPGKDSRYLEIGEVSRRLKAIAKECDVHVVGLAQLNRKAEGREPSISDLRECGDIEQDADNIILLYKEAPEAKEIKAFMGKNRHGALSATEFYWHGATMRLEQK